MSKCIEKGVRLLAAFRGLDPEIPATVAAVFMTVAAQEGMTMKELADELGISQASCSRNVAYLSKVHRLHKPGLDLMVATEDPLERRRKVLKLSPKGKRFLEKVEKILG